MTGHGKSQTQAKRFRAFSESAADDGIAARHFSVGGISRMPAQLSDFPISADTKKGTQSNYQAGRRWLVASGILITVCVASAATYLGYYVFAAVAGAACLVATAAVWAAMKAVQGRAKVSTLTMDQSGIKIDFNGIRQAYAWNEITGARIVTETVNTGVSATSGTYEFKKCQLIMANEIRTSRVSQLHLISPNFGIDAERLKSLVELGVSAWGGRAA